MTDSRRNARWLMVVTVAWAVELPNGQVACAQAPKPKLNFQAGDDRVVLTLSGEQIAEYVFNDATVLRPHLANVRLPSGKRITRRQPPLAGKDATDHADMHPGVWLAFGDINGHDFWRNRSRIEHIRFTEGPAVADGRVRFRTDSLLRGREDEPIGQVENHLIAEERPQGWRLIWEATFKPDAGDLVFGDQEEMGFGARVATEITERSGGTILNSVGQRTAKTTWGKPATWCDSSGTIDGTSCGLTLMTAPTNFRGSWWHNRDYGLIVANAFGRAAMKQGERSQIIVRQGESLQLTYAATFHEGQDYDPAAEYASFLTVLPMRGSASPARIPPRR